MCEIIDENKKGRPSGDKTVPTFDEINKDGPSEVVADGVIDENKKMVLSDLRPAEFNPRKITEEAASGLSASLSEFGDISGIVFNARTGNLVCGHQRVDQLKKLYGDLEIVNDRITAPDGKEFAVRFVDWDISTEKAANIAANNPFIAGEFDAEKLSPLLMEIKEIDESLFEGLRLDDLQVEVIGDIDDVGVEGLTDPDEIPEPPKEPITKPGDVWLLGAYYECEVCGRKYDYEVGKEMGECHCDKRDGGGNG